MTVKDLWIACDNWTTNSNVLIHTADKTDPEQYTDIMDVRVRYDSRDVAMFWILEDNTIAILLKDEDLPF